MTTKQPRIAITLQDKYKSIYEETAKAAGVPTSSFIASILMNAAPNIKKYGEALKRDKLKAMYGMLGDIQIEASEKQLDIEEQIKRR